MQVQGTYQYSTDAKTVYGLFTDQNYVKERLERLRSQNVQIKFFGLEGNRTFKTTTQRDIKVKLPGFASKLVKDGSVTLEESFLWEEPEGESVKGKMFIDFVKLPGKITGDVEIHNTPEGSEMRVSLEGEVNVPVVGKKIAQHVAEIAIRSMSRRDSFTEEYLLRRQTA